MGTQAFLFIAVMIILSFIFHYEPSEESGRMGRRKVQTRNLFSENIVKKRLKEYVDTKVAKEKIRKTEQLLLQSGFKIDYTEFMFIKVMTAVVTGIVFSIAMSNPLLGIMFLFIGYMTPSQVIGFLRNRRLKLVEGQIGSFMHMTIKRYENTKDFNSALKLTAEEFRGEEPIYSELNMAVSDINLGTPTDEVLENMANRTNNKYLERFAAYYKVASTTGVPETRKNLMMQAYLQYEEDRNVKRVLKEQISGPVMEAYIMWAFVPIVAIFQMMTNPDYIWFMTSTTMGRVGTTVIIGVLILIAWFINAKLAAPLD